jgi:hypothetical protein
MASIKTVFGNVEGEEADDAVAIESAFRRGYHHAVLAIADALNSPLPSEQRKMLGDFEHRIRLWRWQKTRGFPPNFP